jgi:hypothetical protein
MNINFIYDPSVSSAPAGFITALNMVAQEASQFFADPITINIRVGWGEFNGKPVPSNELGVTDVTTLAPIPLTYAQLKTALMQHATSIEDVFAINNLPANDPFGGPYYISSAQQKAWGFLPANNPAIDGAIGFSATAPWDFNQADGISPGAFDFMATAEHEITHALGRVLGLQFIQFGVRDLLDLFDYSSPGHLAVSQPGYFSIDGGRTALNHFSTSGDFGDWSGILGVDANNAIATRGQVNPFTSTDLTEMDVLGFNLNWGAPGLPLADNVVLPALTTYQKMYGVSPSSSELWILKNFDAAQSLYGQSIGVQDAVVYMYSALGQALADGSDTGSTAFKSTWGPLTNASDTTFVTQAYTNVFGTSGTAAQNQHFVDQLHFYKSIYTASGAFGTNANEIDLLARGAIYGQMIGVKAENPTAALAAASAPADISLVGVSAQHDITHSSITLS